MELISSERKTHIWPQKHVPAIFKMATIAILDLEKPVPFLNHWTKIHPHLLGCLSQNTYFTAQNKLWPAILKYGDQRHLGFRETGAISKPSDRSSAKCVRLISSLRRDLGVKPLRSAFRHTASWNWKSEIQMAALNCKLSACRQENNTNPMATCLFLRQVFHPCYCKY